MPVATIEPRLRSGRPGGSSASHIPSSASWRRKRLERGAGLHRGDQIGGAHRDHLVERAGAEREVGGRVGRQPGAVSLDPDPPALLVRQPADLGERVGGIGRGARHGRRRRARPAGAEQRAAAGAKIASLIGAALGARAPLAAGVHRDHLARVGALVGVEDPAHRAHRRQGLRVEDQGHVVELVGAHAVLAGDAAARRDARRHDLPAGRVHPLGQVGVAAVEADVGVQVAVAGVEDVADR